MFKYFKNTPIVLIAILLIFWINHSFAASFDTKLRDIRGEINRDNVKRFIGYILSLQIRVGY